MTKRISKRQLRSSHVAVMPVLGQCLVSTWGLVALFLILGGYVPVDNSVSLLWRLILFLLHLLCTIEELASQYWKKNTYIKIQKLIKHIHVCKQRHRLFIDDNDRWVYVSRIYLLWIDVQKRKKMELSWESHCRRHMCHHVVIVNLSQ